MPGHARAGCGLLLAAATLVAAAQSPTSAPAPPKPEPDSRPRLAIIGFEPEPGGDSRDAWIAVALEETLARRLRHVPALVIVPTIRLYQARRELAETASTGPQWREVARGLGAHFVLSGRCRGMDSAVGLQLSLWNVRDPNAQPQRVEIPAGRLFDVLDAATRWAIGSFNVAELSEAAARHVFGPPCASTTALEYYARAITAARADKPRDTLRYAGQSLARDRRFRPALAILAQQELRLGPSGRGSAGRRLRVLSEVARAEGDMFDRARAEIALSLLSQADGAFEAARLRGETALKTARGQRDLYGQIAAVSAICDCHLLRPLPLNDGLTPDELDSFTRDSALRAVQWQRALIDLLETVDDLVAALPAANKLALIYERIDQPEQALEMHRRTLALADRLGSRRHQATAWLYLGEWFRRQQRWQDALDATSHCLALADEASKPAVRMALGSVYESMQLHEQALAQFELAHEQVRTSDRLAVQFGCLRQIAAARMKLGRREKAIAALQEALDIAHALELREEQQLREELERWKQGGS